MSDSEYQEAINILKNSYMPTIFIDLKKFVDEHYKISVTNFVFAQDALSPNDKRKTLSICLLSMDDWRKTLFLQGVDRQFIKDKLRELNEQYNYFDQEELKDFLIAFNGIGLVMMIGINHKQNKKAEEYLKQKFKTCNINLVSSWYNTVVIVFSTNAMLEHCKKNGELEKIKQSYLSFIKPYDEFGVYQVNDLSMQFTSKEIIDKDYDGEIYNYFRCV